MKNNFTPSKREIFGSDKPFRLGLFASSNSGKSHLISELLTNSEWGIIDRFEPDHVFIICPTIHFDDSYDKVIKHLEQRSYKDHEFDPEK
jgi:hypothetical protein